ncbi:glycosyltransferase family 2 protein [Pedosphaera parvula]|uniref:Glycosyl transferase family 2 n=1 Tax=Pedosphaera parvula (strain Ellin514) TaxID=320771 RepID=B9XCA9_PEDPL|nr:glycosyltransferase [Pedosphaera parvula]EEF62577.1 glycosyl transferase family 2 [Pedosphaera parvula Ellin514]
MRVVKVSILIPNYNFARYLPEAIDSVLTQDFRDYELLIVDNCSTDNSVEIIRSYTARDSRIKLVVNKSNLGMVGNLNKCLSLAQGEYIKFVFADDLLVGGQALGELVRMLDHHRSAVAAASARNIIDQDSRFICLRNDLGKSGVYNGLEVILKCLEKNANLVGEPSAVLFRRSAAARGFHPDYNQIVDLEMWIHLLQNGDIAYTNRPLCAFRRHPAQQTELNQSDARIGREQLTLTAEISRQPWFKSAESRRALFTQLYSLKKKRGCDSYSHDVENELMSMLGLAQYARLYMLHRSSRSLFNAQRFVKKHILGQQV